MRKNVDPKDERKYKRKKSSSFRQTDESLMKTIQFTEEELEKLRTPNRQPLDGDYFTKSPIKGENKEDTAEEAASESSVEPELETEVLEEVQVEKSENRDEDTEANSEDLVEFKEVILPELGLDEDEGEPDIDTEVTPLETDELESQDIDLDQDEEGNTFSYQPITGKLRHELNEEQKDQSPTLLKRIFSFFDTRRLLDEDKAEKQQIHEEKDINRIPKAAIEPSLEEVDKEASKEISEEARYEELNHSADLHDEIESGIELESETDDDLLMGDVEEELSPATTHDAESEDHAEDDPSMGNVSLDDESIERYSEKLTQDTQRFTEPILTDHVLDEVLGQEDLQIEEELDDQEDSFVKGAAWLTAGSIFSRILGALYIIPWSAWLGAEYTQANTLYSVGYKPYSLFLAIATAGFPSAIAKQMAFYHSKKEYKVADKLFKYSLSIMLVTGLVSGGLLFILAPNLAAQSATDNPEAAVLVIRSLVPALLILPLMSLFRGYFQGFNDMIPSAVSQILEQIARVFYLLAATYAIMQIYSGEVTQAVVHSTFAAFIGALASLLYLVVVYLRRLPLTKKLKERSLDLIQINFKESIRIMLLDSIPFILLGSGIIIAQIVDTYTFKQILVRTSVLLVSEISELYGAMSLDVDKLAMIIISLAVALASSVVPLITGKFATRDIKGTSRLVEQIVLVFSFVMLPAAVGMASVSNNLYQMFYPQGHVSGPSLLVTASFMSIILGAYTILSTVLQSMNFRRLAVRFLLVGLVVKLILQFPLVGLFHAHGALWSTTIAFTVSSVLMGVKIAREVDLNYKKITAILVRIAFSTVVMGLTTSLWNSLLDLMMGEVGRGLTFVKVMLVVVIGMFVYVTLMGLFGLLNILLGDRYKDLQEKLRVF